MPLKYVVVPDGTLGNVVFVKHLETITRSTRQGRRRRNRPEKEVYEVVSDKFGSFTLTVPTGGSLKGDFYKRKLVVVDARIVIKAGSSYNNETGELTARAKLFVEADAIELMEETV